MADLSELEREVRELRALEDIKRLEHRYFRAMTFSDYETLKGTLTEDVVTSYSDGEYVFEDREELKMSRTGYRRVINQILNRKDVPYEMKAPAWAIEKTE